MNILFLPYIHLDKTFFQSIQRKDCLRYAFTRSAFFSNKTLFLIHATRNTTQGRKRMSGVSAYIVRGTVRVWSWGYLNSYYFVVLALSATLYHQVSRCWLGRPFVNSEGVH